MVTNQVKSSRLKLTSNIWQLRSANYVTFTEERVVYGEAYLSKTMFTNGLNCLKNVEIVFKMKTGQTGVQWRAHLKWWIHIMG